MSQADIVADLNQVHDIIDELVTEAQQKAKELTVLKDDLRAQRDNLNELIKAVEELEGFGHLVVEDSGVYMAALWQAEEDVARRLVGLMKS